MIRYMVVVLARPIFCGVLARPILADIESGTRENEVITPWSQMPYLIQLVQGSEDVLSAQIVFRVDADRRLGHVRSRELRATSVSSTGAHCLLLVGGRTTPPNQVRLASSTGDDIRLLVRLDLIAFCP